MVNPGTLDLRLRPVVDADEALLLQIYAQTRADELALTGWDADTCTAFVRMQFEAQRSHYQAQWPTARHQVMQVVIDRQATDVGRLWVDAPPDSLHVLDIAVLAAWRGQGIGGLCLRRLAAEAAAGGRQISIHVEAGNPALRLYLRLGFLPAGPSQGLHQRMVWRPTAVPSLETCDEQT